MLCTACWERVFAVSATCVALVWPACLTASCRSATLPAADGAPFHWGASERFLADCMRGEGGQAAGSSSPRPVVVSKYIPLPWRVFEPRCMLAALRSSGRLVAVRACQQSGWCRIVAANADAQRRGTRQWALTGCSTSCPSVVQWTGLGWVARQCSQQLQHLLPLCRAVDRLGVDAVDCYLVHSPVATFRSIKAGPGACCRQ